MLLLRGIFPTRRANAFKCNTVTLNTKAAGNHHFINHGTVELKSDARGIQSNMNPPKWTNGPLGSSMASSSTLSNLSTEFLHLSSHDVTFFDAVVRRVPRDANDFVSLKKAFEDTLATPSYTRDHASEVQLWDTLLRLIKVRGQSWKARWESVRMALSDRTAIYSDMEDENGDQDSDTSQDIFSPQKPSNLHAQSPSHTRPSNFRPSSSYRTGRDMEALEQKMAQLSAEASSLAGSFDGDNERSNSVFSPKYHQVPRWSHNLATTVESASDTDDPAGPPRRSRTSTSHTSLFDEVVHRSRVEREANSKAQEAHQEEMEDAYLHAAYAQADSLLANNLLRKCLSWWIVCSRRYTEFEEASWRFRLDIMQGKAFVGWKKALSQQRLRANHAAKLGTFHSEMNAWKIWTRKVHQRRRHRQQERRMELRGAFEVVRSRLEYRCVRSFFDQWRVAMISRVAQDFERERALRMAFSVWAKRYTEGIQLQEIQAQADLLRTHHLLHRCFRQWCGASKAQHGMALATQFSHRFMLYHAFKSWHAAFDDQRLSQHLESRGTVWQTRRLLGLAWDKWGLRASAIKEGNRKADAIIQERDSRLLSGAITKWLLREREQLLSQVLTEKTLSRLLRTWHYRYQRLTSVLMEKEQIVQHNRDYVLQSKAFTTWKDITDKAAAIQIMASSRDQRKVKTNVLRKWRERWTDQESKWHRARAVDTFAMQRTFFALWTEKLRKKRLQVHINKCHGTILASAFAYWRAHALNKRRDSLAVATLRHAIERKIRQQALRLWTNRVIERKSQMLEAAESHDAKLLTHAWQAWIHACLRHEDMFNLCNSLTDVKRERHCRQVFSKWLQATRSSSSRRERADHFLRHRKETLVKKTMQRWYDQYAEAALHEPELQVLLYRQTLAMRSVWQRWQNQVPALAAIRLDHARLKAKAIHHWHDLQPAARARRMAVQHDKHLMQTKAFSHWTQAAKVRRAFRAASRFGGPAAVRLRSAYRRSSGGSNGAFGRATSRPVSRKSRHSLSFDIEWDPRTPDHRDVDISSLRESDFGSAYSPPKRQQHRIQQRSETAFGPPEGSPPPRLRNWIQSVSHNDIRSGTLTDHDGIVSEPGHAPHHRSRTPSPAASHTQSEATVRVRLSPRKQTPRRGQAFESEYRDTIDALRARRRRQSTNVDM